MPSASGRPYLSEAIVYDADIEPYQFIKIYAGVGSGKNVFVDNLVKGNVFKHADGSPVEKKYVLLFTSRRSKANEQLNQKDSKYDKAIGIYDEWDYFFDDDAICQYEMSESRILPDFGGLCGREVKLRSCSCTNAQAETACSEFIPVEPCTHPWERFDFIVIDEVHSILADANYQSAPFYVQRLLEEVRARSSKCKVIVMTGSPEIIKDYPLFQDYHLIDKMDVCDNLTPDEVTFISRKQSEEVLRQCIERQVKTVCFFNRINEITRIAKKLYNDDQPCIAPSFTDDEKRRRLKREHGKLYAAMDSAEKSLATTQVIPDNVVLFLTNAKNKEGINIKNDDIKTMLVHAHSEVDIKQMAGRVRSGIDELYVVVDAPSFDDYDLMGELGFTQNSDLIPAINLHFEKLAEEAHYSSCDHNSALSKQKLCEYIMFIHEKFPYVRFDYFREKFVFYEQRRLSKAYYNDQTALFTSNVANKRFNILSSMWFPDAKCNVQYSVEDTYKDRIDEFIERRNLIGRRLKKKDEKVIFSQLTDLLNAGNYKKLGNLLRPYGYRKKTLGKTATGDWTIEYL